MGSPGDRPMGGLGPRPPLPSVTLDVVRPGLIEVSRDEGVKESRPSCSLLECAGFRVLVDLGHPKESPEPLLSALRARGLKPADVHAVLFTHLHPDHIGHKDLFLHALFVFHQDERLAFYFKGDRTLRLKGSALLELSPETFSRPRVTEEWPALQALGRHVYVRHCPGHTPGSLVAYVCVGDRVHALAGDIILNREHSDREILPGSSWRPDFIPDQMRAIVGRADVIIPGHGTPFAARGRPRRPCQGGENGLNHPSRTHDRRTFLRLLTGGAAIGLASPLLGCGPRTRAAGRRAIVLALDGLDPAMVRGLVARGRLPNFARLAERGAFGPLATTMPALSPVAWSSFITGQTPGGHGIGDFLARDPATHLPVFSIFENHAPRVTVDFGDVHLPLLGGGPVSLRRGKPFWAHLTERGIPAWLSKVPTNFPVDETATRAIAGMGTPDLVDSYGSFSYYTSHRLELYGEISGGTVDYVEVRDNRVEAELPGPVNTLVTPPRPRRRASPRQASIPFTVHLDPDRDAACIRIGDRTVILEKGEYSDWVKVEFTLLPVIGKVSGIVRFLLKQVRPHFQMYATAVNIDPEDQAVPVTYPKELGADIARDIGSFWTKGLPSDTKALDYGILNDEEYVGQAELILEERLALFRHQWSRFKDGLFYFYVSSIDQDSHMLWRNMDPSHPRHRESDRRFADWIPYLYERMDALLGEILPAADEQTLLLVCSDHGFAPFRREFHLNTWLRDNGYLTLKDSARKKEETAITDVDWCRTAAYGVGFNGLYLNLAGREQGGIVRPEGAQILLGRLIRELEGIVDPETGQRPVARVYRRDGLYQGEATAGMAELLVGYTPGYRCSSPSVLGGTGRSTIDVNPWAWSGDHSMACDLVPGTLLASRGLTQPRPGILDLPVTLLDWFGIDRPGPMVGRSLL